MEKQVSIVSPEKSPAEMITMALTSGADLDKLKGLLELQERYEANEARKSFHRAMANFKSVPIKIKKDKTVGYSTSAGKVGYSHASLDNVVRTITRDLGKHGLSVSWRTSQTDKITVTCKITHIFGHSEETSLSASSDNSGSKNAIQAIGSTISYLERYTLLAVLGLATSDMDDDAKSVGNFITEKQLSEILDLLNSKGLSESKCAEFMGVEKLEQIKATDYNKAIAGIKAAKKVN